MKIRLTQLDGKLPNLALMKLSHFHKAQGNEVYFEKSYKRGLFEPDYDVVYGSAIFTDTAHKVLLFRREFPNAIVGGTWNDNYGLTVESVIGAEIDEYENYDYSIYPEFSESIGFTQRGCRLNCSFCGVPQKEGKNRSVNGINDVWRGLDAEGKEFPKHLLLLDNDYFGQPDWLKKSYDIISGGFKVSFTQGINIRLINGKANAEISLMEEPAAQVLARMKYYDDSFKERRIYTAWDNSRDEKRFFKGVETLLKAGIKPRHIMVYFLCNYWDKGLTEDVWHRFNKMIEIGLLPYPMIYQRATASRELKMFQRFVIRGIYRADNTNFETFCNETKSDYFNRISNHSSLFEETL